MTNIEKLREYHKKTGASHYYSSETVLPLLEHIYAIKRDIDEVILSKAHAITAQLLIENNLPEKAPTQSIYGSLGTAFPHILGKAFINPHIIYHIVFGDGEWDEGSNWEAYFLMRRLNIKNIKLWIDLNGSQGMGYCNPPLPEEAICTCMKKGNDWTYHYKEPE